MKRFIAVLSGLLVLPAFAEVAPIYYDEIAEEFVEEIAEPEAIAETEGQTVAEGEITVKTPVVPQRISPRNATGRSASRAVSATAASVAPGRNATAPSRAVTARTATAQPAANVRSATTRGTVSRASRTANTTQTVSARATASQPTQASVARATSNLIANPNDPLYTEHSYSGTARVSTRSSSLKPRSRIPTISVSNNATIVDTESAEDMTTSMDELAQITDFCKAQYTECMDNFCNVLDDNQGRCSCSKNLETYAKTEAALEAATTELQEIAQKIQYIGLNGEQIETLFTQTEAEATMQSKSDNTQLKNDLDNIRDMIVDVKSANETTATSGFNIDLSGLLDFTIDSTGFDLSTIFGGTSNNNSISNQRGEELYKTASARCKATVLNNCQTQGVDTSLITNSYDLEIDKQCLAYERSLTEANDQMASTVRNAKAVLQKARLLVAQQKNSYDLRGCVKELDKCMQDEFVCGSDYENCLDPTGKYIVNGDVVVGSTPGHTIASNLGTGPALFPTDGLYATWNYGNNQNAWADAINTTGTEKSAKGDLAEYIAANISAETPDLTNMAQYLQNKIGYHDDDSGRDYGMCMSVLNQCQNYTYSEVGKNKQYNADNQVIREYLYRTLTKIKTQQDEIIADFAENCISDVSSCLAQNNYPDTPTGTSSRENIAINACRAIIATCMSVNGNATKEPSVKEMLKWTCDTMTDNDCGDSITTQLSSDSQIAGYCEGIKEESLCTNAQVLITGEKDVRENICAWNTASGTCSKKAS